MPQSRRSQINKLLRRANPIPPLYQTGKDLGYGLAGAVDQLYQTGKDLGYGLAGAVDTFKNDDRGEAINRLLKRTVLPRYPVTSLQAGYRAGRKLANPTEALARAMHFDHQGEKLAETILGPIDYDYSPVVRTSNTRPLKNGISGKWGDLVGRKSTASKPPSSILPPSAPVDMPDPDPNQAFAREFPDMAKDIARKSAGLAPEDQAPPAPIGGLYDTGGLDRGDPTSFAPAPAPTPFPPPTPLRRPKPLRRPSPPHTPPVETLVPAWEKREDRRDRLAEKRQSAPDKKVVIKKIARNRRKKK